ncbi:hypothetical protein NVP1187O_028 [Vibrio phage 1.187.O._10N.286.49.F1]|nr:hypothetical protein NVP1187O_028 [Vibrio phage 1.187.O._10N.286.49.F1]
MKATLNIRDTSWGSLYCRATVTIEDDKIVYLSYAGMPRVRGDRWYPILSRKNCGEVLTLEDLESIVNEFHGRSKVKASITKEVDYETAI